MWLFANSGLVRVSQVKLPFHAAFSRLHCENRISFFGVSAKSQWIAGGSAGNRRVDQGGSQGGIVEITGWIAGGCAGNRSVDPRLCAGPVLQVVCTRRAGGSSPSTNGVMQSTLSVVWQVESIQVLTGLRLATILRGLPSGGPQCFGLVRRPSTLVWRRSQPLGTKTGLKATCLAPPQLRLVTHELVLSAPRVSKPSI